MALAVVTVQPNSTSQTGTATVVGAATANAALSDGSDSSYIQLSGLCRLDSQVCRVGFPLPTLPAGAQIYSVTLRRRIQTVVTTPGQTPPVCNHWFRTITGLIEIAGQLQNINKTFFTSPCPVSQTTSAWTTETVGTFYTAPGGTAWTLSNLTGFTYDIGRGDSDTSTYLRISEVYLDITYQQLSSVTLTGPSGSITSTRPTVTWTYSSPDSQPQQSYQVGVYTAAQVAATGFSPLVTQPLQTSGVVLSEDLQWTLPSDLTDGSYVAYLQATSRWDGPGTFPTAIASTSWTRAATPASPPPAAVLNSVTFDSANNRVAVTFSPGAGTPLATAYTVQASRDGGITWLQPDGTPSIPSLTLISPSGTAPFAVYDYVAPINITSQYRVISYDGTPFVAATAPSNVLTVTPYGNQHWLKHPTNPLLNTPLPVASPKQSSDGIKVTKRQLQATYQLLSGSAQKVVPIVVSGPVYGDEYEMELIFHADSDPAGSLYAAVQQLFTSGSTLLLQKPNGDQLWVAMGPGASGQDIQETYNALPGDPTTMQWRRWKVTFTETNAPAQF